MKKKDYIPSKDAEFDIWQDNLVTIATANAVAWHILAAALVALGLFKVKWDTAWAAAKVKETRTSTQVKAKKLARKEYELALRSFVQQWIQNNPNVTDADTISMGIKPKDSTKTSIPVPKTIPQLDLIAGTGSSVKSFFRQAPDEAGVSSRGKPAGVAYCEVAYVMGPVPPKTEAEFTEHKNPTRSPLVIKSDFSMAGQRLYAMARWVNTKGEAGQWSPMQSAVIPG